MHLVTGASGFVGGALMRAYERAGDSVVGTVRESPSKGRIRVAPIDGDTDWGGTLEGVDVVIHLAARVHVMEGGDKDPDLMHRVNVEGTMRLAQSCVMAGVRRFVFVSTIKVNGECTGEPGAPEYFTSEDTPSPNGAYAVSKFEAEQRLRALCDAEGMELCIIRPPLVYGPGAGGNFRRLVRLVNTGVPLPFAAVDNRRSMLALDNLVSLLRLCATSEAAAGHVFLASDGHDISTPELIRELAMALGRPARLVRTPPAVLEGMAGLLGRREQIHRLCRSLQVDISKTCQELDWVPPVSLSAAISASVAGL